jgi:transcriptional regulator with XRE-family HTH domain
MVGKQKTRTESTFDRVAFGAYLKATRRSQGLSQPELADRAGVAAQVISNLENGRSNPTVETIFQLAKGLALSPDDLFGAGVRGGAKSNRTELDRVIEILSRFNARETREAISILEAVERLRG